LAKALHDNGLSLVYGGGTTGIMGEIARTMVSLSGSDSVHGIIPKPLVKVEQRETAQVGSVNQNYYGRMTVVPDMHTRKQTMAQEVIRGGAGGGFVALSGGYGTLEELMEITTWNQLGIHSKPVVLFNVDGYWDGLIQWMNKAVESGFVSEKNRHIIVEATTAEEVVSKLKDYKASEGRFNLTWNEQ
jgi:uncharacterized protein (TIGR00730 family)